jgi:hypothetical protein
MVSRLTRAMSGGQNNPKAMHDSRLTSRPELPFAPSTLFSGITILESEHCKERVQWRFPRSKRKRIRRKWAQREENVRYEPRAYRYQNDTLICHPSIAKRLREELPPNAEICHSEQPKNV